MTVSIALALALAGEVAPFSGPVRVHAIAAGASRVASGTMVAATVQSGQRATLSTRISATVRSVAVDEGARVRKDQLLVSLSDADLRGQLRAAATALEVAAAQEKRMEALVAERAAVPIELDAARAQRAQAEAAVAAVRAQLAYTQIRAPFAGRVQAKRVSAGDLVGPGQPLVELEGAGLEIVATLSEAELAAVEPGQLLPFTADGRAGMAQLIALSPGGDSASHRQLLRARITSGAAGLRSGSFARLQLPGGGQASLSVPRTALVERGDLTGVFVARAGRAELRWLALGEPDGDRVPVRAGLSRGELVIDDPGALADGAPVEVADGR